ncbi:MAG: hypothetical protein ACI87N_002589 [Flavobacteriales bacterium]|jgi:hypothetical protein|uniref:VF530 family protein n=1 Tax=Patiriisocius sp. Uisw_047 TaxID=3230969 RepID=UPI0039E9433A
MDTENDYENESTDKLKLADEFSDATLKPKANDEQIGEKSAKKIKRKATEEQLNHPLHGVKLVEILESLVDHYGWPYLADRVNIRCFMNNPTMKSSLGFLRKMTWAREHVEDIYMDMLEEENKKHR